MKKLISVAAIALLTSTGVAHAQAAGAVAGGAAGGAAASVAASLGITVSAATTLLSTGAVLFTTGVITVLDQQAVDDATSGTN